MTVLGLAACGGGDNNQRPPAPGSNANLSRLPLSDATLTPVFAPGVLSYTADAVHVVR